MQHLNISRMSKGGLVGMAALEQEIVSMLYVPVPHPNNLSGIGMLLFNH